MDHKKAGFLKFYCVQNNESREEQKKNATRNWFILRKDGILLHSSDKSKSEISGRYINVPYFDGLSNNDDEFGFQLTTTNQRLTYYFMATNEDERVEWTKVLQEHLKSRPRTHSADKEKEKEKEKEQSSREHARLLRNRSFSLGPNRSIINSNNASSNASPPPASSPSVMSSTPEIRLDREESPSSTSDIEKFVQGKHRKLLGQSLIDQIGIKKLREALNRTNEIRNVYSLYVKVSEARNLKGLKGDVARGEMPDPYCILTVESSFARTRTVSKNSSPLWTEEFHLELSSPDTSSLVVTVWDENKSSKDRILGKLQIPISKVKEEPTEDWYPLTYASPSAFVCGDVHIRVEWPQGEDIFLATVIEARNLGSNTQSSDAYCKVIYGKSQVYKTKVLKKSLNPDWNETFRIKIETGVKEIVFQIFRTSKLGKGTMLGQVKINQDRIESERYIDDWFLLQADEEEVAREQETIKEKSNEKFGDLRLTLSLSKAIVFPLSHYEDFLTLLLNNPSQCIEIFEKTAVKEERDKVAEALVKVYEARNQAPAVLKSLLAHEIEMSSSPETLFRANSVGSKAFDMYMKMCGYSFLYDVVHPTVEQIYNEKKGLEIEPSKLEKGEDPKKNFKRLVKILEEFLDRLFASTDECPTSLREIFAHLAKALEKKFPEEPNIKYIGVSGFLFLRFICAAILGPKLFNIMLDHPDPKAAKALTVVARIVQKIASIVPPSSADGLMGELESFISKQQVKMKNFIDLICTEDSEHYVFNPASVDLGKELAFIVEHLENHREDIVTLAKEGGSAASIAEKMNTILDDMQSRAKKLKEESKLKETNPPHSAREKKVSINAPSSSDSHSIDESESSKAKKLLGESQPSSSSNPTSPASGKKRLRGSSKDKPK